jgi:hypothetical protein
MVLSYSNRWRALHFMPGGGKLKEEDPLWLAVRQCGDLS